MKKYLILVVLISLTLITNGQGISDQQNIAQLSIEYEKLQTYLNSEKQLIIKNNGVISPYLNLSKFNQPVIFMTTEELFFNNRPDYIEFIKFNVSEESAEAILKYPIEQVAISLSFKKTNESWELLSGKILQ
jgi:hypothetical protein